MQKYRLLPLCAMAIVCTVTSAMAQTTAPAARIVSAIDDNHLVTLAGSVHPSANARNDQGPVSSSLPMQGLTLVLSRSADRQAAFDAFVECQYDSSSPNFHQWLTAAQIGERFGPADSDIAAISGWLMSQGFKVSNVAQDRMAIDFSGTAGQVASSFHTRIHKLLAGGESHIGNMDNPQIPAALGAVIVGVKGLHNFLPHPLHKMGSLVQFNSSKGGWERLTNSPAASLASGGVPVTKTEQVASPSLLKPMFSYAPDSVEVVEDVAPYDFAAIYNLTPLWNKSVTGTGQSVAILGTSNVYLTDVSTFKSAFGLPAGLTPVFAHGGVDPGVCTSSTNACGLGDLEENTLDVEWAGAVAPGAQIVEVTTAYDSQTNPTNDPLYLDAQYVINNVNTAGSPVYHSYIMSLSYGLCELGMGTASNVAYRNLWQTAAAAGIAVFVATGDSGSPACDQGMDSDGMPYSAQYGLAVNGLASTQFNTAVGGTDFSWCNPSYTLAGKFQGCSYSANANGYWNSSNASTQATAKGYVAEMPWNDSCLNPVWSNFIASVAPLFGYSAPTNPEASCNFIYNYWPAIANASSSGQFVLASLVDSVGGGGGASNCVVNDNNNTSSCASSITSTGASYGNLTLVNDGWPKPSWQTGVTGIPTDGVRDIPDVSFFAGDGSLNSATLVCLATVGATCASGNIANTAIEIGGTSVATPQMAGVMALINQNAGGPQGNPNSALYQLAGKQSSMSCSAGTGSIYNGCYFNDVDRGNISMPCNYNGQAREAGVIYNSTVNAWVSAPYYTGLASPNCTTVNTGDVVGELVSSGNALGYAAGTGYDLASGLGSLNVANIVNAANIWTVVGTASSTVTVTPTSGSIYPDQALSVTVVVSGASGTPSGTVTISGAGYSSSAQTLSSGSTTFTVPANSLSGATNPFTATLTVAYSGDVAYAQKSGSGSVIVSKRTPTSVTVTPASSSMNSNTSFGVSVAVAGAGQTPTGTITLTSTGYSSSTALSSGVASFTIPVNTFTCPGGNHSTCSVTLAASYNGDSVYVSSANSAPVTVTYIQVIAPTVTVTPASGVSYTGKTLAVTVSVTGANGSGTGNVTLSYGSSYTSSAAGLTAGSATITIPANTLPAGTDAITGSYAGDSNYTTGSNTASVTVTQSTYALSATAPSAISRGSTASSTITGTASSSYYTGTVTASSCTLTSVPSGAVYSPTCSASGSITYAQGTASGSITAGVATTAASAVLVYPKLVNGKGWLGAGSGVVLALLVFFGVPARRRGWRAILGVFVLLAAVAGMSACGKSGTNSSGSTSVSGTTSGNYTFTVTTTGSPTVSPAITTTFTVTVN